MDVFQKCLDYHTAQDVRAAGLYPYYRTLASAQDPEVVMADGQRLVMLGSNNYLGLTNHPEVKAAAAAALARYGTGCAGSRLLNGSLDLHEELEARLASFMRREAALTFSTGYQSISARSRACSADTTSRSSMRSTTPPSSTVPGSASARSTSSSTTTLRALRRSSKPCRTAGAD